MLVMTVQTLSFVQLLTGGSVQSVAWHGSVESSRRIVKREAEGMFWWLHWDVFFVYRAQRTCASEQQGGRSKPKFQGPTKAKGHE